MGMVFMQAIILAGGESSRMGQDKALLVIKGKPLLQWHLDTFLERQIPVKVMANDNKLLALPELYANSLFVETVADAKESIEGPLSGLLSGLSLVNERLNGQQGSVIVQSCDVFGLPISVFDALEEKRALSQADIACLNIEGRVQPLVAVLSSHLLPSLLDFFNQGGRSVMRWYKQHSMVFLTENDLRLMGLKDKDYTTNLNTSNDVDVLLQAMSNADVL